MLSLIDLLKFWSNAGALLSSNAVFDKAGEVERAWCLLLPLQDEESESEDDSDDSSSSSVSEEV